MSDLDEVRRPFRRETGKLDRWIYQGQICDYFVDPKEEERVDRWLRTRNPEEILRGDFYDQFKVFSLRRMRGMISWEDWRRETRNLYVIHQRRRDDEKKSEAV